MIGLIVKGIGGFYYVKDEYGNVIRCRARGIFKNEGIVPYVGDSVDFEILEDGDGIVNVIYERKNQFIRPPIANVDVIVVVTTAAKPKPVPYVIDKFLVMAERSGTDVVICINKTDKSKEKDVNALMEIYNNIYEVVPSSAADMTGIDQLKKLLAGKKAAFAGPSGVGKSTLINAIQPDMNLETGEISKKTSRGKHTTRHVEIFEMEYGGMIYDTPGFTSFEILEAEETELQNYYPEISRYKGKCKYDNCIHIKEPECRVREAVEVGEIHSSRYDSYVRQIEEIRNKRKY